MKTRIWSLLLCAALLLGLCACGNSAVHQDDGKLKVVTTIFPIYDWTRTVAGGNADQMDLIWLLDSGVDLHSYQPTVDDMLNISNCDVFIYVGGESDAWVTDALSEAVNPDMTVISLLNVLGGAAKEEETVEGMEEEAEAEDGPEYDEHVWLSLRNAEIFVSEIAAVLSEKDPDHAAEYQANAAGYLEQLQGLDRQYETMVQTAAQNTLLFGDRFPFRYLTDDYGLHYYAAFAGCSAETEASFETVAFLSGKLDELGLHYVLTIEGGDGKIARTIIESTQAGDQAVLTLDSMQGTTAKDVAASSTYLSIMEDNLAVLETALN